MAVTPSFRNGHHTLTTLIGLLLAGAVLATYAGVLQLDFVRYDDQEYVTENPVVLDGLTLQGLRWAFTVAHSANWHPLTWLSHMLDCQVYGVDPRGHHWTNVIFHALNTLLLFLLLHRMTGARWRSAFVAALFALHPLHVESVAWVAERKDVLSTFFGLLACHAYARYAARPGCGRYLWVVAGLALSLMAKPMLVTLPFVLLLLDYWPLGRLSARVPAAAGGTARPPVAFKRLVIEKLPLLGLSLVSSILTIWAQSSAGAVRSLAHAPVTDRIANAVVSYAGYLKAAVWPSGLAVFYPHPGSALPLTEVLAAGLAMLAMAAVSVRLSRSYPWLLFGLLWYLGTLVPVIGLVQVGQQAMADRYTYVPLIGPFIALAWGADDLAQRWHLRRGVLTLAAMAVLVALSAATARQIGYWRNTATLFERAIAVSERNWVAHNNYGMALFDMGRYDEAIRQFEKVLEIRPNLSGTARNLARALEESGDLEASERYYRKSIRNSPGDPLAYNGFATLLYAQGKTEESIRMFQRSLQIKRDPLVLGNLANVFKVTGRREEAETLYREVLLAKPDHVDAHYHIAVLLAARGELREALHHLTEAIRVQPDYAPAYTQMGAMLARRGHFEKAAEYFERALQLDPADARNRRNLEWVRDRQRESETSRGQSAEDATADPGSDRPEKS